jgi:hypothetical protein
VRQNHGDRLIELGLAGWKNEETLVLGLDDVEAGNAGDAVLLEDAGGLFDGAAIERAGIEVERAGDALRLVTGAEDRDWLADAVATKAELPADEGDVHGAAIIAGLQHGAAETDLGLVPKEKGHGLEDGLTGGSLALLAGFGNPPGDRRVETGAASGEAGEEALEAGDGLIGAGDELGAGACGVRGAKEDAKAVGGGASQERGESIGSTDGLDDPASQRLIEAQPGDEMGGTGRGAGDGEHHGLERGPERRTNELSVGSEIHREFGGGIHRRRGRFGRQPGSVRTGRGGVNDNRAAEIKFGL